MESIKRKKTSFFLLAVIIIAGLLRLYALQFVPPSPSLDEVSIGYNAYSFYHTGRDEYGYFLPLLLRAYDDWRPILYVYFTTPFVGIFGLHALSVRLPSVILSLVTIYLSFLLVQLIFKKRLMIKGREVHVEMVGLLAAFLVSVSPWQIYLSRLGHEVNLGLFITVLGVFSFLKGVMYQKKYMFLFSVAFLALSFYSYQSQKIIIPILLSTLILFYHKEIRKLGKWSIFAGIIFLILTLPAIIVSLSPDGMTRFKGTSVFSANQSLYAQSASEVMRAKNEQNIIGEIYHNRRFVPVRLVVSQYISHFNPRWLFAGELRENHKVPHMGLLYLFEAPFLLVGMTFFLFSKIERRIKIFMLIWFLSNPLPGAITTDAPHAMRSYTFIPTLQIFEALGVFFVFSLLKTKLYRVVAFGTFLLAVLLSLWQFLINYFYVFPKTQADSFQSSLFASMKYIQEKQGQYDEIIVSNEKNLYQSYMFYLFNSSFDPASYQRQGGTGSGGFAKEHKIGGVVFRPIRWNKEKKQGKIVYIGNKDDFLGATIAKTFPYPDGKDGVVIVSYD